MKDFAEKAKQRFRNTDSGGAGYELTQREKILLNVCKNIRDIEVNNLVTALLRAKTEIVTLTDSDRKANKVFYPKYIDVILKKYI